jgi:hypothetical protein
LTLLHCPTVTPASNGALHRLRACRPRRAATALLAGWAALAAHAEPGHTPMNYFQAGIGAGMASTQTDVDNEGSTDWMLGYRINPYVGVQAIGWRIDSVQHSRFVTGASPVYDFSSFTGVQVVGFVPCTAYWDLYGELGGGQVHQVTSWPGVSSPTEGDGVAGIGARWQMVDHFALSLGVARLWNTQVTHTTLRAEFNF